MKELGLMHVLSCDHCLESENGRDREEREVQLKEGGKDGMREEGMMMSGTALRWEI